MARDSTASLQQKLVDQFPERADYIQDLALGWHEFAHLKLRRNPR